MRKSVVIALAAIASSYACSEPLLTQPEVMTPAYGVNGAGKVPFYNGGIDREAAASPCRHAPHDEFDFWVGSWHFGTGRSVIRKLLDGCVIEENYMPPTPPTVPGGAPGPIASQGRSLSMYDHDTGRWHQTYLAPNPRSALRMSGPFQDGVMRMGFQVPGLAIQYNWFVANDSQVVQSWTFNGAGSHVLYTRIPDTAIVPSVDSNLCSAGTPIFGGDIIRRADFLLGEWDVANEKGETLGVATFTTDMAGCLIRESYETNRGYSAASFIYHDLNTRRWHRTLVDSEGQRVELSGLMPGQALVLAGGDGAPGPGIAQLRNTIRPIDANSFTQVFETSDDAVTWRLDMTLTYRRR